MDEIEALRQMTLNVAARVGVLETLAEGLLATHARLQGVESLKALTDWMQMAHQGKPLEEGSPELAQWLRKEEARRLKALCEHILLGCEEALSGRPLTN